MAFRPQVDQTLKTGSQVYRIAPHPAASWLPYGQEGRTAIVYQLVSEKGEKVALKVFKMRFRQPSMVELSRKLAPFASLPGLRVCERTVLTPSEHTDLLSTEPDLAYAVLMPWVDGPTWMDILGEQRVLDADESLELAKALATILQAMEEAGVAHCDLSAPNVILPLMAGGTGIELVDVEGLYGPGLPKPGIELGGTSGYNHRHLNQGVWWGPLADRFAGSILLAEMLGWFSPAVREASWGESFFDPAEMQTDGLRYQLLWRTLQAEWGQEVADLFARAWFSPSLDACPSAGEWAQALASIRADAAQPVDSETDTAVVPDAETTAVWEVVDEAEAFLPSTPEPAHAPQPPSPAPPPSEPEPAPVPAATSRDPTEDLTGVRGRAFGVLWTALYLVSWSFVVNAMAWSVGELCPVIDTCDYFFGNWVFKERLLLGIAIGGLTAELLAWVTQWAFLTVMRVQDKVKAAWWGGANLSGWIGWILTWAIFDAAWGSYGYGEWMLMMAAGGFTGGLMAGTVQWLLVHKRAERAWGWIIVSAFSWAIWVGSLAFYWHPAALAGPLVAGLATWLGLRGVIKRVLAAPQAHAFSQEPAREPAAVPRAPSTSPAVPSPSPLQVPSPAATTSEGTASPSAWTPPVEPEPSLEESVPVAPDMPVRGWHSLDIEIPGGAGGGADGDEDDEEDFIEFDDPYADGW